MVVPWAIPLICLASAAIGLAAWFLGKDRRARSVSYVAHTRFLRRGARYRSRMARLRLAAAALVAAMGAVAVSSAVIVARPSELRTHSSKLASRDLILCLDVSGSVEAFDAQVLKTFAEMVDQFHGERVALVVWNRSSTVVFPLSDDYAMVKEELGRVRKVLQGGRDVDDLYTRTSAGDRFAGASLIGDGLVSCTQSFDYGDKDRSRTILFATDNWLEGSPAFKLKEAASIAHKRKIRVLGLLISGYPQGRNEFRSTIQGIGGKVYDAQSARAGEQIVKEVQAQDKKELAGTAQASVVDTPGRWPALAGVAVVLIIGLAWRYRL